MKTIAKIWLHILLWVLLLFYFVIAPDLFTRVFIQNGKPLQTDGELPAESDRIKFVIEDLVPSVKDGEELYELIGWAFLIPDEESSSNLFIPEIVLVSDERTYFFWVRTVYRQPNLPPEFADLDINLDTLGLSGLIAEDIIKPGRYRIGIIFRNTVDGSAFYRDKPVYYLVKTPNTLRLRAK
jgi:hypothetical protein